MGISYLWDTNTAIYYLLQLFSKEAEDFMDGILKTVLKNFIADSVVFELDQYIKDKTVEFRKTYAIKLPDAIIAASAFYE